MFELNPLRVATCAVALLALTGCQPNRSNDEQQASMFVSSIRQAGTPGYVPTGYGWKPASHLEISIWHEPDGPGSARSEWRKILDVHVDGNGWFGFNAGAPFHPVSRTICGAPESNQTALFLARNPSTGKVVMRQVPVDLYFTFRPCP